MQLVSPLVHVLIRFVASYCFSGTLIDLSRENETGQPARVKHCGSTSLRCRSRFTRSRWRLHLAFAYVCPPLGRPHLPSVPKRCCSLRQHLRQLRQLLGTQLGLRTWCWSAAQSNDPLRLRSVQPLAHDTFTHPRAAAISFCFHPGCDSSQAELPTTFLPLVWFMSLLHPSSFTG
jgi:hypothetical protein